MRSRLRNHMPNDNDQAVCILGVFEGLKRSLYVGK